MLNPKHAVGTWWRSWRAVRWRSRAGVATLLPRDATASLRLSTLPPACGYAPTHSCSLLVIPIAAPPTPPLTSANSVVHWVPKCIINNIRIFCSPSVCNLFSKLSYIVDVSKTAHFNYLMKTVYTTWCEPIPWLYHNVRVILVRYIRRMLLLVT